jgi:MFS family permease
VEGNDRGWGSPLIVGLFAAAALLALAFALVERYGRYPMLTPGLVHNRQFMGASTSLLLFAVGMMGMLFLTILLFVNLWDYSELEAALAISPVALAAMVVSPIVGRLSNRVSPRAFGVPALVVMFVGLLAMSTLPAEPSLWSAVWRLTIVGIGVGATFPAVSIGSMGSIRGQELGLGSGIVNMARQVGFAIGVALFVAVFSGSIDNRVAEARVQVAALARQDGLTAAQEGRLERKILVDPSNPSASPPAPRTPLEHEARDVVREEVRDAYAAAFRVGAFVVLLAIPFSLTMKRRPAEVAEPAAAAVAG